MKNEGDLTNLGLKTWFEQRRTSTNRLPTYVRISIFTESGSSMLAETFIPNLDRFSITYKRCEKLAEVSARLYAYFKVRAYNCYLKYNSVGNRSVILEFAVFDQRLRGHGASRKE